MILQDIETMTDAEKLALVKAIQENVASSKAKQVSMETGQYAKLVVDAIKKIKTDLEERYAAISADIAVKSAAIKNGVDGINGAKGEKGDTGLRGLDGANGRDGIDGRDGVDGVNGNGVADARIDFDGSLIITLDNGTEINAGEVVPLDVAEKIKVVGNGGGTSQYVLDTLASLQAAIDGVSIPSQTGNAGKYLGTTGSALQWEDFPDLTITDTFVVNTQAAMLALSAQKGDVAVRTDLNKTFILTASPATTLGNWQELLTPTDLVTSVAGRTGNVTLSNTDISGLGTMSTQAASSVAITGGTATLTSLTTPTVQATNSGGLSLKNSAGTTQLSMGAGGGDNLSLNVSTNINGTNAQIDISPTGTGHVHIKPTGVNSIEIAPVSVGDMDNMIIGAITPAAGTFTTLIGGGGSANYGQLTGGATTKAVEFKSLGSDANVAYAIRSKGTGAIDLAAGSRGVNISNGDTVTAITKTSLGSNYTSPPALAISAPTTAGGVTATATTTLQLGSASGIVISGGSGYAVGDDFYVVGGTYTTQMRLRVATLSGSAVATVTSVNGGEYTVIPSTPASTTTITGTGSGCTITPVWALGNTITITNAGSGYVEQPTVTFSGGGGSGAAAYASVGSNPTIKSLTNTLNFATPAGTMFSVLGTTGADSYGYLAGGVGSAGFGVNSSAGNASVTFTSKGTSAVDFYTNGYGSLGLRVSHTASAVNYVQVTGATTASKVVAISAQGSDTDVTLSLSPKGAGTIRFGTYTGTILTPTGYITITDSGGTSRRLLVG